MFLKSSFIGLLILLLSLNLSSVYAQSPVQATHHALPPTYTSFAKRADVMQFIEEMVKQYQFDREELISLFNHVQKNKKVITKTRHPYETKAAWSQYRKHFLQTEERVTKGIEFWQKYQTTLERAEEIYGVSPSIITAIIGVESNYGRNLGRFRVLEALSTLAFDYPPRQKFFRRELVEFLLLCVEKNLDPTNILGSYAGAIGQPQFMPSSFRNYAIDFSQNGTIDLTHDEIDVIGSIANFLSQHGWHQNQPLIMPTIQQSHVVSHLRSNNLKRKYTKQQLINAHITPQGTLPDHEKFGLVRFIEKNKRTYWIGLHNLYVLTKYNQHIQYAMIIYALSQQLEKEFHKITNIPVETTESIQQRSSV